VYIKKSSKNAETNLIALSDQEQMQSFSELFGELCKAFQLQALDHPIVLQNHHFDLIAFHCNKFAKNNSNPFH
jgi:hypothetical protein